MASRVESLVGIWLLLGLICEESATLHIFVADKLEVDELVRDLRIKVTAGLARKVWSFDFFIERHLIASESRLDALAELHLLVRLLRVLVQDHEAVVLDAQALFCHPHCGVILSEEGSFLVRQPTFVLWRLGGGRRGLLVGSSSPFLLENSSAFRGVQVADLVYCVGFCIKLLLFFLPLLRKHLRNFLAFFLFFAK